MKRLCVFAGSSPGARPEYRAAAEELGRALARRNVKVVYGGGYFDGLLSFLDHSIDQRFVKGENGELMLVATSVERLLEQLDRYQSPPPAEKWIDRATT